MSNPFDLNKLEKYLSQNIKGFDGLSEAVKFIDGQSNPTYRLITSNGDYVLRSKPAGRLLKSAHAVDREFRVIKALETSAVPVPQALHLCEDEEVIGAMFYVMSFVDGKTYWDPSLPQLSAGARETVFQEMNRVLSAIHSVDLDAAGLRDFGKAGNYYERQYTRWVSQYRASETENLPAIEAVIDWLGNNMVPDDGRVSLVHGDFRLDNLMFCKKEPKILSVLDWELSTLGHPFADIAYQIAIWRLPPNAALRGLGQIDRALLGIPSDEAYLEQYCERMNIGQIENWNFYLAFSLFRMAAIIQGVKKRALDGNASSQKAHIVGALVGPLADEAASLI